MPKAAECLRDIHEINLMYLLLLQRMARTGKLSTLTDMRISARASQWLADLKPEDLIRLAKCSMVLAQLNLKSHRLLATLSQGMNTTLAAKAPRAMSA